MKTNAGLKAATVQYAKTRPVFEQYKATKYSRKFLAEHEADLELYRAAQAEMRSLLGGAKLPKMDVLKEEGRKLTAKNCCLGGFLCQLLIIGQAIVLYISKSGGHLLNVKYLRPTDCALPLILRWRNAPLIWTNFSI